MDKRPKNGTEKTLLYYLQSDFESAIFIHFYPSDSSPTDRQWLIEFFDTKKIHQHKLNCSLNDILCCSFKAIAVLGTTLLMHPRHTGTVCVRVDE